MSTALRRATTLGVAQGGNPGGDVAVDDEVGSGVDGGTRTIESEGSPMIDDAVATAPPGATRWRRATTRFGAFGAGAAVLIGSCGPGVTQCAPTPAPPPVTSTTTTALSPGAATDIVLAARPVQAPCTFSDTWGAARSGGRVHLGTDIMAAEGQEVYAVHAGQVTKVYREGTDALAGNGIRLTQPDGTYWFYAHLSALAPEIAVGVEITPGQVVGWVGHTGNAGVNHLHLELHPGGGTAVNSYPVIVASGGAC